MCIPSNPLIRLAALCALFATLGACSAPLAMQPSVALAEQFEPSADRTSCAGALCFSYADDTVDR